jgi:epsilon-lactone hydrolase
MKETNRPDRDAPLIKHMSQRTNRRGKLQCSGSPNHVVLALALIASAWSGPTLSQEPASRTIPARVLPAPDTVSPVLQKRFQQAPNPNPAIPTTAEEWKALAATPPVVSQMLVGLRNKFGTTVVPEMIGGVQCYVITPKVVNPKNRNRLLLGLHGGGNVAGGGENGILESIVVAGLMGYKVIHVDYRMLPEHPFPAAIDDVMAVWKAVIKTNRPGNMGVFGTSAGGNLALSLVQRARKEGLPLPGALMLGSPWSDMSKSGDSYYANDGVDNIATTGDFVDTLVKLYANGHELKDPLISPVYGDFGGFPPTFLVSGTRDLFLSNTVRVQEKLLQAGVPTELVVGEAQSHIGFLIAAVLDAPEGVHLYSYVERFFDAHLGR